MKIMFINSVVDTGSTGKIVRDLANALKAKDHQVMIAYGRNEAKVKQSTFNMTSKLESAWHLFMTRLFGRHGLHSSLATKKLIAEIERFKPDVIHLHNLHGYYLNVPQLMNYLKKQTKLKIVWTMHDLWAISGSSAHYAYAGCQEWNEGCVVCNDPKEYPYSILFNRQRKNFAWKKKVFSDFENLTIITVSNWMKQELEKSFFKQYEIIKIYNGLDFNDFVNRESLAEPILPSNKINLLGVVSDWKTRKGSKDFVALSKVLDDKYQITVVGLSDEQLKTLPNSIVGIKKTANFSQLIDLYRSADLYLNLSAEESMGMTSVESLGSGTPVVAYDQTANPEIIDDSVGAITPINDIGQLKKAIIETLDRKIPAHVCVEFAKKHYSIETMIEEHFKVYNI